MQRTRKPKGVQALPTETEYHAQERARFHADIMRVERAPLVERRAARTEWMGALHDPEMIGERVGWMLNGSYGKGAYDAAREILARPRMNVIAWMSITIAALEWGCPAAFAREAWSKLSQVERDKVDLAIRQAIKSMEA